jgi:hypothetical protein
MLAEAASVMTEAEFIFIVPSFIVITAASKTTGLELLELRPLLKAVSRVQSSAI